MEKSTATILDNGIGNRLLEFVYALSPNKPFVHFEVILDKDGNPEMSYIGMKKLTLPSIFMPAVESILHGL